ncbi:hypothetical protein [Algoriphagus persicinus]|uniref:hypothetical protein n=1 Tax=Algoriphagus persicinus TaxID=3108754 RepID=UPI002B3F8665|nr:hypothetical protein [Algoriphagus sp. E1-3-M2]MEB2786742.1 hypothetical protein [Algoriphagus sp. E1-3-M2]
MKNILSILTLNFLLFISCSKKSEKIVDKHVELGWEILDSLDLEILGIPMLTDVSSDGSKLIFYDYPSSQILITDTKGIINHSFSKQKDTPDFYGFMLERPGFYGKNQLAVYGGNGLFIFDLDGNMQKKIPHPESLGALGSNADIGKSSESVSLNGKDYFLPKSVRPRNSFPGKQEFYDTYRALELVDVEAGTMTEMIPFEEGSHFLNGKGYIQSDYTPALEAKDGKLYIVHGGDPQLYIYRLSREDAKLDTMIQLQIPGFIIPEGRDRAEFREGHVEINGGTASIRNIHILENLLLLDYYSGMDPKKSVEAQALWESGKVDEARAMYRKLENEIPKGTLVFNIEDLSYLGNVSPPAKTGGRPYASGGGFAWFQKLPDPEIEEDFLRVYKMKLTEK